jgi:uroporphyrinogen decarboxylase
MLFDSWAGVLSPSQFRAHVIGPTRTIVDALKRRFPRMPIIGFPRLSGMLFAEYVRDTGVQAVGMDTGTDPVQAAAMVPQHVALQGNLDPMALVAGPAALDQEVPPLLAAMRSRPFIFNLGHGIVPQTSPEHVRALLERVRAA